LKHGKRKKEKGRVRGKRKRKRILTKITFTRRIYSENAEKKISSIIQSTA